MVCLIAFSGCGKQSDLPAGSPSAQAAGENGGGVIVAKFAHALSPQSPYQTGAEKFKELVEEKTGGKVVIEIYPNGQLGAERDLFEGLKLGTVEFAVGGMGVLSQAYEPKLEVFGLPFMFESREEVYEVLDDIECGRANPTFETMDLVAAALGVELEELLQPEQVIDLLPKNDLARYQQMLDRLPPFAQEMVIAGLEGAISQCLQVSKEW